MGKRAAGGPQVPKKMKGVAGVYCLYVGNRHEKSVTRRLNKARKDRGYSIHVIGEYPGYLDVEARDDNITDEILETIFRGCGVRRICGLN